MLPPNDCTMSRSGRLAVDDLTDALERLARINAHAHEADHEKAAIALMVAFRNREDATFDELVAHVSTEFDTKSMVQAQAFLAEMLLGLLMTASDIGGLIITEAEVTDILYRHLTHQPQGDQA